MRFGLHVSIAGGIFNAPDNAAAVGCETFQMFTRSPRGGAAPTLTPAVVKQFKAAYQAHGFSSCYVHTPYYINLASSNQSIAAASVRIIREELDRSSLLGVTAVMTHLGSGKDHDQATAQQKVVDGLLKILDTYRGTARFLIEIAAGAGAILGASFEEINHYISIVEQKNKRLKGTIGVCFDTCHAFALGYDLRTKTTVDKTLRDFDQIIGLERLSLIHANDSKTEFNGRRDRHENIGQGKIGLEGFRALVNHPQLKALDMILETPGDDEWDRKNLATMKRLRG